MLDNKVAGGRAENIPPNNSSTKSTQNNRQVANYHGRKIGAQSGKKAEKSVEWEETQVYRTTADKIEKTCSKMETSISGLGKQRAKIESLQTKLEQAKGIFKFFTRYRVRHHIKMAERELSALLKENNRLAVSLSSLLKANLLMPRYFLPLKALANAKVDKGLHQVKYEGPPQEFGLSTAEVETIRTIYETTKNKGRTQVAFLSSQYLQSAKEQFELVQHADLKELDGETLKMLAEAVVACKYALFCIAKYDPSCLESGGSANDDVMEDYVNANNLLTKIQDFTKSNLF